MWTLNVYISNIMNTFQYFSFIIIFIKKLLHLFIIFFFLSYFFISSFYYAHRIASFYAFCLCCAFFQRFICWAISLPTPSFLLILVVCPSIYYSFCSLCSTIYSHDFYLSCSIAQQLHIGTILFKSFLCSCRVSNLLLSCSSQASTYFSTCSCALCLYCTTT